MKVAQNKPSIIDAYIAAFPPEVRQILKKMRSTIKAAAPNAQETISYKIPTFTLNGRHLIYFAGYQKHVAVYPVPAGDAAFRKKIEIYRAGRGTLRFPLDQPIPYELITRIVKLFIRQSAAKAKVKAKVR